MRITSILFTLCFCGFVNMRAFAQGRVEGLPISVRVNTPVNLPDGVVELTGVSNSLDGEPGAVDIAIVTPGGATHSLSTRSDATTGVYFVRYTPKATGMYKVTAFAADHKQKALTEFEVSVEYEVAKGFASFDAAKKKAIAAIESSVTAAIASVAKEEDKAITKDKLAAVKQKLLDFDKHWSKIKDAIAAAQTLAKKHPEIKPTLAPALGQLASKLEQSTDVLKQLEKDLGSSKAGATDECNKLYQVSEGCALFSTTMNLASGGILAIGASVFIDKVWPQIETKYAPKSFDANDHFVFKQTGKTALTALDGLKAVQTGSFGAGMAGDFVQFVSDGLFKKYCAEYKGPISGTFALEFRNEGKMYMKYKLTYEGKASVYCRKDKLNGATPKLSGYLEGNVTKVEFTDDVWAMEKKEDWIEVKYQRIPAPFVPKGVAEADSLGFGAAARSVLPGSFYFPLEAQMVQGKIIIKLLPAHSDFTESYMNRTVMVVRAKAKPYRVDGAVFQYPIQKARFFLTRSMRMKEGNPTVTLEIETKNGVSTMEKEFTRNEAPDGDTVADFFFKLSLSNQ